MTVPASELSVELSAKKVAVEVVEYIDKLLSYWSPRTSFVICLSPTQASRVSDSSFSITISSGDSQFNTYPMPGKGVAWAADVQQQAVKEARRMLEENGWKTEAAVVCHSLIQRLSRLIAQLCGWQTASATSAPNISIFFCSRA